MGNIIELLGGAKQAVNSLIKIVVVIIVLVIVFKLYKKYQQRNVGKAWVDPSQLDPNKNYDNIAKGVNDAFSGYGFNLEERADLCNQISALNNNEIKEVNNRYFAIYGQTLQDAITSGYIWTATECNVLAERLKTLNLN